MSNSRATRRLVHAALGPDGPGTICDLMRVVAQATSSVGAVLWEAPDELRGDDTLSVLAHSLSSRAPGTTRTVATADSATRLAYRLRSLVLPEDTGHPVPDVYGRRVAAALPVEFTDGCRGALTLLGDGDLDGTTFDTAVDLVDLLPELCSSVRERQTLALINACNTILHDADIESPERPLTEMRLAKHLSAMCGLMADGLQCAEVSIFLADPGGPDGVFRMFASSNGVDSAHSRVLGGEPADLVQSGAGTSDEPLLEVRLRRGDRVCGSIRCRGTVGPPHHFTPSDLDLLRPIAAQVSSYWRNWLNRWALHGENESWRRLAAGMTSFNKLLADGLDSTACDDAHEKQMSELAARIVHEVVPESSGATVFRAVAAGAPATAARSLVATASSGELYRTRPAPSAGIVADVLRTRLQSSATERAALAAEGVTPENGWLLCTPIRVGHQVYGLLEAAGPTSVPPANSAQVHEIIGDQIGLYRHLEATLRTLNDTSNRLEKARRSEADAMEDLKHQLVGPLRTAADRTERVLRGGRFDSRVEAQLKAIRGLCRKAGRVAMSAGVFATLSNGGRPEPKTEQVGVDDLLRLLISAADDAQVLGNPRRGITFDVERDAVRHLGRRLVRVDASFLQQCVGNLLDNAAKYAYECTRVRIDAEVTTGQLVLRVTSTGLPMSQQDLQRCLERNWRGDAARTATGEGSGIGLWIVDNLMRAMDGRVGVVRAADDTTVRLTLQIA